MAIFVSISKGRIVRAPGSVEVDLEGPKAGEVLVEIMRPR